MSSPGSQLRQLRLLRKITFRQVVSKSQKIAQQRKNPRYLISLTALSHLERDRVVPGIYRIHALALIYHSSVSKLLSYYGI